jgi:pyruvate,water dikinase
MVRTFPTFGYNPVTGEWNDTLTGEFLWSNVNVSEAVPDVMTPSTWSLWWIYHYEASPFEFPGDYPLCGNICGRPYLNLSLLASVYRAIGKDIRKELQGDMIGSAPAELDVPYISFSPLTVLWKALPGMLKAQQDARHDAKQMPEFIATMPDWCRTTRVTIQGCQDASSLLFLWKESIKPAVVRACRLLRSVTMTLSDPATKLRLDLIALIGEADTNAILSNLSGPSGNLASLGPLLGLAQVMNNKMSRETYLERFGHRGPHEMELFAPGSDDDPAWFEKQLADFTRSPADVDALLEKQRVEYNTAWKRFEARYPAKVKFTRRHLEKVSAAARNREGVRSEVTRVARLVRSYLLRAGDLTGVGDSVFFLSLDETADLLAGNKVSLSKVPSRREMYLKYSSLPPYPSIVIGKFDPFQWAADPNRRNDYFDSRKASIPITKTIKGFAGAAGIVEGLVRRIDRMEDGDQIRPGEILVTTTTNVGWTPLFPRLSAIVTDVGAPLSHAAIVARELGIPAVVGCGNATMLLRTGDHVRVDGIAGTVELLERKG